jgi:prephenate dehydratase
MKRISMLGPGTFSEESSMHFTKHIEADFKPYKLISDVFMSTVNGETDYSVIPIENTIEGSVSLHLDWIVHEVNIPIQAEWVYPIDMNLIGYSQPTAEENSYAHIQKVLSHSVALAQCRHFLREHIPHAEIEVVSSTAECVRLVREMKDPSIAGIGPLNAAYLHDIPVLARSIQDYQDNVTRFLLLGHEPISLGISHQQKTTILVTLPEDYPGGLHQLLSAFAWRRINLSRIESRPTKRKLGTYYFYIEIEGTIDSILLASALQEIEAIGCQVRTLGCYPCYNFPVSK